MCQNGQRGSLRVAIVTPAEHSADSPARTAIAALGFRAYPDSFELQRFRVMSEVLGWRVLVVQTPSYGHDGTRLTHRQIRALAMGDFHPLARAMTHAVITRAAAVERPVLLGYSMGASTVAAMGRTLAQRGERFAPSRMVLVEPVAAQRWSAARLGLADHAEERWVDHYLAYNRAYPWAVSPADRQGPEGETPARGALLDQAAMVWALSRGRLSADLVRLVSEVPGLRVDLVHGQHSRLVPPEAVGRLGALVHRAGGQGHTIEIPDSHHPLWHALPCAARIATELRRD